MIFAALYGLGAVMGMSPSQVDGASLWQFMAAADGYAEAHGATPGLAQDDEERLARLIESYED